MAALTNALQALGARAKQTITRRPNAVADLHKAVRDAAVVAWPSREFGEEIAAFVVLRDAAADLDNINGWCRQNLARYKVPREILPIDDLPKSGVGKVLKNALSERLEPIG